MIGTELVLSRQFFCVWMRCVAGRSGKLCFFYVSFDNGNSVFVPLIPSLPLVENQLSLI